MPGVPLRRRLLLLTAAGLVPLGAMAGIGLFIIQRQQYNQAQQVGLELARSIGNAVDAELRSSISVLEALVTTPMLDTEDLPGFLDRARRVMDAKPEWAAVVLADPTGRTLVDTRYSIGSTPPLTWETDSFERVLHARVPAIGGLMRDGRGNWFFAVRAPVWRAGQLRYVATALVRPEGIHQVLARQQVPSDWIMSVVDARGVRVARSRAHVENLGGRLSDSVQRVVGRGGSDGSGVAYALEGERIFAPYSRVASGDWMIVLGIPTASVDAAIWGSLAVYGGGILLSIGLGAIVAIRVARSITRPIAGLRAAAEALGRRQAIRLPETTILEINDVGAALKTASEELTNAETERNELLRKERL